jgi:flagellar motor switch protein FliN
MPDDTASAWLGTDLARQLSRVLESMVGEAPQIEATPAEIPEAERKSVDYLWWQQPFSLAPEAVAWIAASHQAWEGIGGRVLRAAGVEEQDLKSYRTTYLEVLTQSLSSLASSLSSTFGREVTLETGCESAPPSDAECLGSTIKIVFPDMELQLLAGFSVSLADRHSAPTAAESTALARSPESTPSPNPIDLLLDVELPVSISFGRAQLALKDVIKLSTGSIVELNRSVSEPVEVIVNNCVIARGEVVVIEGNFGIRIKQVISRQERLRTLN